MVFVIFLASAAILAVLGILEIENARTLGSLGLILFGFMMLLKNRITQAAEKIPTPEVLGNKNMEALSAALLLCVCAALLFNVF